MSWLMTSHLKKLKIWTCVRSCIHMFMWWWYNDLLVAYEIGRFLTNALPSFWRWTKSLIIETLWFWPNPWVKHSNNNVAFKSCSFDILGEAHEVPWPCRLECFLFVREHGHYSLHSYNPKFRFYSDMTWWLQKQGTVDSYL